MPYVCNISIYKYNTNKKFIHIYNIYKHMYVCSYKIYLLLFPGCVFFFVSSKIAASFFVTRAIGTQSYNDYSLK